MVPIAIHPGEHLAEELKELNLSAAELARKLGAPANRVTQILNGMRAITGDTALRAFLRHGPSILAEFTEYLRPARRPAKNREIHQVFANFEAP